ncbi:hypothetical protein V8C42DRAFT_195808 [Trichoderma barbatum]
MTLVRHNGALRGFTSLPFILHPLLFFLLLLFYFEDLMYACFSRQSWTFRRILELWDKQGMELILDSLTTLDFFFLLDFPLFPFSFLKWGRQGTVTGPATCGGNGPRIDGSGDSDYAGVENGDQVHGLGLWVYHWVYGKGLKAQGLDIGH